MAYPKELRRAVSNINNVLGNDIWELHAMGAGGYMIVDPHMNTVFSGNIRDLRIFLAGARSIVEFC